MTSGNASYFPEEQSGESPFLQNKGLWEMNFCCVHHRELTAGKSSGTYYTKSEEEALSAVSQDAGCRDRGRWIWGSCHPPLLKCMTWASFSVRQEEQFPHHVPHRGSMNIKCVWNMVEYNAMQQREKTNCHYMQPHGCILNSGVRKRSHKQKSKHCMIHSSRVQS